MLSTSDPPELPYPWKCPQLPHKVPSKAPNLNLSYVVTLMAAVPPSQWEDQASASEIESKIHNKSETSKKSGTSKNGES